MGDAWDDRKRSKEEEFFERQNREALARKMSMTQGKDAVERKCPVDGRKLEHLNVANVAAERCPQCHGVWLEPRVLEQLMISCKAASQKSAEWYRVFFFDLFGKK